jgi:hypothetical protein
MAVLATLDIIDVSLSAILLGIALASWIRAGWGGESPPAPPELCALLCLTLSFAVVDLGASLIAPQARELFIARFGDLGIPTAIAALAITTLYVERKDGTRQVLIGVMGLLALLHEIRPLHPSGDAAGSSRQLLGLLIPLVWIVVLLSPRVKRYCSGTAVVAT